MRLELLLPALGLIVCSALLLRLLLPQRQRSHVDAAALALWRLLRHGPSAWLARRRETRAQREAREAIERARAALQHGARRPGSKRDTSAKNANQGPAEVHDLDQHRRKRRPAKPPEDDPPEPPRPTLH